MSGPLTRRLTLRPRATARTALLGALTACLALTVAGPGGSASAADTDALPRSTVDWLPERMRPYARLARLDRPIGSWLLFWP